MAYRYFKYSRKLRDHIILRNAKGFSTKRLIDEFLIYFKKGGATKNQVNFLKALELSVSKNLVRMPGRPSKYEQYYSLLPWDLLKVRRNVGHHKLTIFLANRVRVNLGIVSYERLENLGNAIGTEKPTESIEMGSIRTDIKEIIDEAIEKKMVIREDDFQEIKQDYYDSEENNETQLIKIKDKISKKFLKQDKYQEIVEQYILATNIALKGLSKKDIGLNRKEVIDYIKGL